jgi:probable rRNA maturation factor
MSSDEAEAEAAVEVQIAPEFANVVSAERLQAAAGAVLRHESRSGELTLVLGDDQSIQALNRDFLGEDAPTDVLSFSAQEDGGPFVAAQEAETYLGDVIISYPRAAEQAAERGHPVEQELDLLVVHGVLHLLGYDHAGEDEKAVMWARQDDILGSL